jgi:hypothetical protein
LQLCKIQSKIAAAAAAAVQQLLMKGALGLQNAMGLRSRAVVLQKQEQEQRVQRVAVS